jgi:peptide/nickel transport system permease protein
MMLVPMLILVSIGTFVLVRAAPGNPALLYAGGFADPQLLKTITHELGLDQSWPVQYLDYVKGIFHGTLGVSAYTGDSVLSDLSSRLPATLDLIVPATILAVLIAVPLGIVGASTRNRPPDFASRGVTTLLVAIPDFFLGLLLIQFFYVDAQIGPSPTGRLPPLATPPPKVTGSYVVDSIVAGRWSTLGSVLSQMVLPVITLALAYCAPIARQMRTAMIDVLGEDYIRTSRAYGLPRRRVLFRHGLRNALLPVVTMTTIVFVYLIGGDVLVEVVFNWPGMGQYAVQAIQNSDYAAVQGVVLVVAILICLAYLMMDFVYTLLDPRIRLR